jgi:diguanylate cyclase (GGDEF)-like protein/PAS domain S-box-containing protein
MRQGVTGVLRQAVLILWLFVFCLPAWALEPVTLQLKWQHQFQFAGYYAALEKGYYQQAGLDVSLREARAYEDPIQNVLDGHAHYGVGTSELLLLHHFNQPVVVLAVIFQHSPLALLVHNPDSASDASRFAYQYIQDLKDKPIMMEPNSAELLAYLEREGLTRSNLNLVDHTFDSRDLLAGKVAAMSVYVTDEPFLFQEQNINYQLFKPIMGGIDFYGDNLFTTEQEVEQHPQRVLAFREASLKGWEYAMAHPEEMIDLIYEKYSQRHSKAHLRFEYEQMLRLIRTDLTEIGYMYKGRWQHIGATYAQLNMLPKEFNLDGFLFNPDSLYIQSLSREALTVAGFLSFTVLVLIGLLWRFNYRLRKKALWLNAVFNYVPSALMVLDQDGKLLRWNKQAETIFGWRAEEVIGKSIYEFLIPLAYQTKFREGFKDTLINQSFGVDEFWCYSHSGKMIMCEWHNGFLQANRVIAMASDITRKKELELQLSNMAHSDPLTGVANRTMFFQKFEEAIALAKRRKEKVALLFIDLDDFKIVNDQYGHEVGDVVLCEVVQRIKMAVREADMLARIGGDEFVLILHDCETEERALQVAEKVLFHLERPIHVTGLTVIVGGSIGISFFPDNGTKPAELLKSADNAMYSVKQKQKNGVSIASSGHKRH